MTEVFQNNETTVSVVLVDDSTGDPLTGVIAGDITLYYTKQGSSTAVSKTIDTDNFREVDATNMPGIYQIDFTASELDTLGEFRFLIQEGASTGGGTIKQTNEVLEVVEKPATKSALNTLRNIVEDQTDKWPTPSHEVIKDTTPTFATKIVDNLNRLASGVTASDLRQTFTVNGSEVDTTLDNFTEISGLPGYYSYDLPSAITSTVGDVLMQIERQYEWDGTTLGVSTGSDALDDIASSDEAGSGLLVIALGDNGLYESTDKTNWTLNSGFDAIWNDFEGHEACDIAYNLGDDSYVKAVAGFDTVWIDKGDGSGWFEESVSFATSLEDIKIWDQNRILVRDFNNEIHLYDGTSFSSILQDFDYTTTPINDMQVFGTELWLVGNDGEVWYVPDVTAGTPTATDESSRLEGLGTEDLNVITKENRAGRTAIVGDAGGVWISSDTRATFQKGTLPDIRQPSTTELVSPKNVFFSMAEFNAEFTDGFDTPLIIANGNGVVLREGFGSSGQEWEQETLELRTGLVSSPTRLSRHQVMAGRLASNTETGQEGVWVYGEVPDFEPFRMRFEVGDGVNLTPINDALDDIKGVGFNTSTDSLEQLRDATDLTPVTDVLDDMKGGGFTTATDSLEQIRDAVDTRASASDLGNLQSDIDDLGDLVERILGLTHENFAIRNQTYDSNNNLTGATVKIYPSKSDTDSDTNEVAEYTISATYDSSDRLIDYSMVKEP